MDNQPVASTGLTRQRAQRGASLCPITRAAVLAKGCMVQLASPPTPQHCGTWGASPGYSWGQARGQAVCLKPPADRVPRAARGKAAAAAGTTSRPVLHNPFRVRFCCTPTRPGHLRAPAAGRPPRTPSRACAGSCHVPAVAVLTTGSSLEAPSCTEQSRTSLCCSVAPVLTMWTWGLMDHLPLAPAPLLPEVTHR